MRNIIRNGATALGVSAALALAASGAASAAPISSGAPTVKAAAPGSVTDVRHRGRYYGRHYGGAAVVGGLAAGIIGMAAANALAPRYYYYDEPTYYGGPYAYYGPRYYQGPDYYDGPYRRQYWREQYWNDR